MRRIFLTLLIAILSIPVVQAQGDVTGGATVVRAEYFFDTDPGYGNATIINNVTSGDNNLSLSVEGLSPGAHMLYVRSQASDGVWSATQAHPLLLIQQRPVQATRVEYFYDTDPGYGKGKSVGNLTDGDNNIVVSVEGLSYGVHHLCFRAQDNQGVWSQVANYSVFVTSPKTANAMRIEYFFDTDPGYGMGTSIGVAQDENATYALPLDGLSMGAHMLYLRVQDNHGRWSSVQSHPIYVMNNLPDVVAVEYFFDDDDPGEGQATAVPLPNFKTEPFAFEANTAGLSAGEHHLKVRLQKNNGFWTLFDAATFTVEGTVVAEAEPYAVLSEDNTVLTFYYDNQKLERNGMDVGPFHSMESRGWYDHADDITSVVFDSSFAADTTLTSTDWWFTKMTNLVSITGLENLNTQNVTSMFCMFWDCSNLTSLDLSHFNTEKVTTFQRMLQGCYKLAELNLSNLNTTSAEDMSYMFLSCVSLTILDLSSFNTSNVTDMLEMFKECSNLKTIYVGDDWTTSAVTSSASMFEGCTNLVGGKGTTYDANHVDYAYAHIDGGPSNPGYFTSLWSDRKLVQWRQVGGKEFRLYKANHRTEARTNADGWEMYRTCLTLDVINGTDTTTTVVDDGSIYCEQNLFNNAMTQCMMIDVDNNKMYVFANSKTDARDYSMDGYVYISPVDQPSFTKETVFTDANWGWFSYFRSVEDGQPLLSHFNYLGYYDMISKRSADGAWSTEYEDSPIASPNYRENKWIETRKFTVVGDTSSDEVTLDGVTYTVRNGNNAWLTWLDNCTYVESLTIPETIETDSRTLTVNGLAPLSCYTLTRLLYLELPSTMEMLGESVLIRCGNLKSLTVNRKEPPTLISDNGVLLQFTDIDSVNCELRVPYGSKTLYESTEGWRKFQNIVEMEAPVVDPEPYAVLSDNQASLPDLNGGYTNGKTLTFYYDDQKTSRNGMGVGPFLAYDARGWHEQRENITNVVFDESFANDITLTSTAYWFYECNNLITISGISNLNTANVTSMGHMFYGCSGLTNLDVTGFNTANVTNMSVMFWKCSGLTSLDVSNFNTANVTDMSGMFSGCSGLTSLDLSNFNTANVTSMYSMFYDCSGLMSLDLSNFNTANVTSMSGMFFRCSGLTSLDLSGFNTANVPGMSGMFSGCSGLTSLDLSNFNTANVRDMNSMFSYCSSLTSLNVSSFNTANVTDMYHMFWGCSGLTTIYAGNDWSTAAVTSGLDVFSGCTKLVGGAGTTYDANHTDNTYAHIDGGPSNPGYFTDKNATPVIAEAYAVLSDNNTVLTFYYDTEKQARGGMDVGPFSAWSVRGWHEQCESITNVVFDESFANDITLTSTAHWFYGCRSLTTITGISNLRTDNVRYMRNMFRYCTNLTELDVREFNTENVEDMRGMFSHCSSLTNLDVSGFKTDNVTDMMDMFDDCSKLTDIDVSHFNTEKVTTLSVMFQMCSSLTSLDLSNFNTSNVTNTQGMFYGCSNLVSLDVRNFDMSKVNNGEKNMFTDCSSLAYIIAGNAEIPAEEYAQIQNPNLLVYVNEPSLAPQGVQNVVVNGVAKEIVLTDVAEGNNNFFVPQSFTAERITYTRNFAQETQPNVSRGWESISLPFNVQNIVHETKGELAPFGSTAEGKKFWLRRLADNGLTRALQIEANVPYVISMPNSSEYTDQYNLAGRVTFFAENTTVPVTTPQVLSLADSSIVMMPTMLRVNRSSSVWALNVGEVRGQYLEGSVFERDYRTVRPFEAYTVHYSDSPAPRFVPIADMNSDATGIEDVRSKMEDGRGDRWYDLNGRRLQQEPDQKGVYLKNGRKVVVH